MYVLVEPKELTEEEVLARLAAAVEDKEKESLVLSAIYFCSTEFAFHRLAEAFSEAGARQKRSFMVMFGTFFQIHRTSYGAADAISEINSHISENPDNEKIGKEAIEEIEELIKIFGV